MYIILLDFRVQYSNTNAYTYACVCTLKTLWRGGWRFLNTYNGATKLMHTKLTQHTTNSCL